MIGFLGWNTISCVKEINYGSDPYGLSANQVNVKFYNQPSSPSQARPGDQVTYKISGLAEVNINELDFFVNNNLTQIVSNTDSTITVLLPEDVSTGSARMEYKGQIFAGPITPIIGKVAIDQTFNAGTGAIGGINTIKRLSNGQFFLGGNFTDYNGNTSLGEINGLARITSTGEFVSGMSFGEAAKSGSVSDILELPDGKILISGNFNKYDKDENVRSLAVLNNSGSLNKESVTVLNLTDDPEKGTLIVPTFNGGIAGAVLKTFLHDQKLTVVGNFTQYTSNYYPRSTYNNILRDYFRFNNVLRLNLDGSLDSTYLVKNDVFPKRGTFGVNGSIQDVVIGDDGSIVMVGSFTRFDNSVDASRILKLKSNGEVDANFVAKADNSIMKIVPTANGKYFLLGSFLNFNGQRVNNIVLVNADGSIDSSFTAQTFAGGIPNYLAVLNNGLILVTGTFNKYNNVIREGLMVLNPDGSLAKGYNNSGKFVGNVQDSFIGTNSIGQPTITLVGYISSFNGNENVGNIIRLTIQD